jgi:predicted adenine nucleotide alpha hydrolase (AANH) superfamily ATPase
MRILLHVCCGPCALYPLRRLREQGHEVTGLFYNPNIHPYQEFRRRLDAVRHFAQETGCPLTSTSVTASRTICARWFFMNRSAAPGVTRCG